MFWIRTNHPDLTSTSNQATFVTNLFDRGANLHNQIKKKRTEIGRFVTKRNKPTRHLDNAHELHDQ